MLWRTLILLVIVIILALIVYGMMMSERALERILRWTGSNSRARILDLGVGRGIITLRLSRRYPNTVGIDVVDKGSFYRPIVYDGHHIPYSDNYFDIAICTSVLHHAPNQIELLDEMRRVARYRVIIQEDIIAAPIDWALARMHIMGEWGGEIKLFHSADEWKSIFAQCGFELVHSEPLSRLEGPLIYPISRMFFVLRP